MKNHPPTWTHPFGTDQYSRDLLSDYRWAMPTSYGEPPAEAKG